MFAFVTDIYDQDSHKETNRIFKKYAEFAESKQMMNM
jgi:hypothetical protein